MTGRPTLEHFTDDDITFLRRWFDHALRREAAHGGVKEWKLDARRGGWTLHVKVHDPCDLSLDGSDPISQEARHMAQDWQLFTAVVRKLLDIPDGYQPPAADPASGDTATAPTECRNPHCCGDNDRHPDCRGTHGNQSR